MKKIIIVLTVFTFVVCYSQTKSGDTKKVVSKSAENVSIKQFEKLEKTANNLYIRINRLKDEKDALEKKFEERGLTTEGIAEKAQNFYSDSLDKVMNSFDRLLSFIYWLVGTFLTIFTIFQGFQYYSLKTDKDKIKEQENQINDMIDETNENFAMTYMLIAKENKYSFDACMSYFAAVFYASRCKKTEYLINGYKLTDITISRIENWITTDEAKKLKITLNNALKDSKIKPSAKSYYERCLEAVEAELKKVEDRIKEKEKNNKQEEK